MSIERGDLKRLVHNEIHIDEFESKLGKNRDVVVLSLKVAGKAPGQDICAFVERGYDWILDADVSSGEMNDGDYIVFVELPRDQDCVSHIMEMMADLMNLTEQELTDYRVRYRHDQTDNSLDEETLRRMIPASATEYDARYGKKEIDSLKTASGMKVDTKAPKNEYTESLRVAAGIL
jgi:hypothetical protein